VKAALARRRIVKTPSSLVVPVLILLFTFISSALSSAGAIAQEFTAEPVTGHIHIIDNPAGEDQIVITSEKGLVVFDTFWSALTARKYRGEIARIFGRDDFFLTVNMIDRLDYFGGNAAYEGTTIVGQRNLVDKYRGKEKEVEAEIKRLIDMWRWKENVSRERMKTHEPGSEAERIEISWTATCKERADDLEQGFSLVLPNASFDRKKSIDLGDITLELIWFGRAGYDGMTVAVVPEEKTAIIPGFIMHSQHLTAHAEPSYVKLDVPRWIEVLEGILEGDDAVERVLCDSNNIWTRERAHTHLVYLRELWNQVKEAETAGRSLEEIQNELSLEGRFAFVKEMQVYKEHGDDWVRPQHRAHVRGFFLQHKKMASEILKNEIEDSPGEAVGRLRKLRKSDGDLYFDETSINDIGYFLMNSERAGLAVEVLELNAEIFPESANAWDSLAEACAKNGDKARAIELYRKSLELNPANVNATEMLRELGEE
jgi:tetratricopeptide (TPR) repeat protein